MSVRTTSNIEGIFERARGMGAGGVKGCRGMSKIGTPCCCPNMVRLGRPCHGRSARFISWSVFLSAKSATWPECVSALCDQTITLARVACSTGAIRRNRGRGSAIMSEFIKVKRVAIGRGAWLYLRWNIFLRTPDGTQYNYLLPDWKPGLHASLIRLCNDGK